MKTTEDVREAGLYASDCCLTEKVFNVDDCFCRCPHCQRLCEWEQVEAVEDWMFTKAA